ncbi:hypothetical protein VNI00_003231 [Paramarasmius palmivorus]|uniref:Chromo domain-containing protein n=1 Tax=Paramarasmius palmivorus TaxID=297713 RepID=A0AAW0DS88_9AGAR
MSDDNQYEVESILRARVAKKSPRSKFVVWQYLVKWKGYDDPEENTWEPVDSFEGSEHFVEAFWTKTKTGGRDREDLSLFEVGEEFAPNNARKTSRKSLKGDDPSSSTTKPISSRKRKRDQTPPSNSPTSKRGRPRTRKRARNGRHKESSPEPPLSPSQYSDRDASFELDAKEIGHEMQETPPAESIPDSEPESVEAERPPRYRKRGSGSSKAPASPDGSVSDMSPYPDHRNEEASPQSSMPAHHARVANPLVKMIDEVDEDTMETAISTKARLYTTTTGGASSVQSSRKYPKPGPTSRVGKKSTSSLLTVQKGKLTTVKGKYVPSKSGDPSGSELALAVEEESHTWEQTGTVDEPTSSKHQQVPASGQQLLELARPDASGDDELEDYEEGTNGDLSNSNQAGQSESLFQQSCTPPDLTNGNNADSIPFFLNLDVSVTVPVVLNKSLTSGNIKANTSNDPPGKFYGTNSALALLDTLRTGGPSAQGLPQYKVYRGTTTAVQRVPRKACFQSAFRGNGRERCPHILLFN